MTLDYKKTTEAAADSVRLSVGTKAQKLSEGGRSMGSKPKTAIFKPCAYIAPLVRYADYLKRFQLPTTHAPRASKWYEK